MYERWQKLLDFLLGPDAILGEAGVDPSQEGLKTRAKRKTWLIILLVIGLPLFICGSVWGVSKAVANSQITRTATITPEVTATLPGPVVSVESSFQSPTPLPNILTSVAAMPTGSATPTSLSVDTILTSLAQTAIATACPNGDHFLTQLVCDDLARTATMQALGVGTVVNVSGVDPNVTTVYIYPTDPPTPWIVTTTPTNTPVVITATEGPTLPPIIKIVTATPGPTQTPWFFITQPPVITVVYTQIVIVTATPGPTQTPYFIIVTATPTDTPVPSDTPLPTETPTP